MKLTEGIYHFPHYLSLDRQRWLAAMCLNLLDGDVPGYVPVVRGGGKMHVRMLCLGRHWNGKTYRYEDARADFDGKVVPLLPDELRSLAVEVAELSNMPFVPDLCIINHYDAGGRMGLHQDKDEGAESLDAGLPVVSLSVGDTGHFMLGGLRRRDEVQTIALESGDAFVFGGPARLRYHGVSRILSRSGPSWLELSGRLNLTFRRY